MAWTVYIVECHDGTFYTGITTNIESRIEAHNTGKGAKYTSQRSPVKLVWSEEHETRSSALIRENAIKKLTRTQKQYIIMGQ